MICRQLRLSSEKLLESWKWLTDARHQALTERIFILPAVVPLADPIADGGQHLLVPVSSAALAVGVFHGGVDGYRNVNPLLSTTKVPYKDTSSLISLERSRCSGGSCVGLCSVCG